MYGLGAKRALGRPQKPMVCPTCRAASPGCNETPDSRYAQPAGPRCGTKRGGAQHCRPTRPPPSHPVVTWLGFFYVIITPRIAYPLVAVACKILDSTWRGPFRVQPDRGQMAWSALDEVRMVLIGCCITPGVPDTLFAASRRALPLGLTGQPPGRPGAVRRRLEPTH